MQKSYSDKSAVEIGSVRKYRNFVYVKTNNDIYEGKGCRKNWKCYSLNRYLWEQHYNEKLLDNESIIPLDGNKNNHTIDNLCKVDMSLKVKLLNQNAYGKNIITKAMISVLELEKEMKKI